MKRHTHPLSWTFNLVLLGVIVLTLVFLSLIGAFPGRAALQTFGTDYTTNSQKAAILGGLNLLPNPPNYNYIFLPNVVR